MVRPLGPDIDHITPQPSDLISRKNLRASGCLLGWQRLGPDHLIQSVNPSVSEAPSAVAVPRGGDMEYGWVLFSALAAALVRLVWLAQGVRGPPYRFFHGNLGDIRPNICVADYAMAKQLLAERTGLFAKNRSNANLLRLLGEGLVLANGDDWHRHKKVVHPAFNTDKLKMMTATISGGARNYG